MKKENFINFKASRIDIEKPEKFLFHLINVLIIKVILGHVLAILQEVAPDLEVFSIQEQLICLFSALNFRFQFESINCRIIVALTSGFLGHLVA